MPSRLFIYYNERAIEGTTHEDCGTELRNGFKSINCHGVCEEFVDYDLSHVSMKPPHRCYQEGLKCHTLSYQRIDQDLPSIKTVLSTGRPIVFGFIVDSKF